MSNIPITITLPEELVRGLHLHIPKRQVSKFIADLISQKLDQEKRAMIADILDANKDKERNQELAKWDEFVGEGLDETNEY